jgi:hypothetical protein
MLMKTRVIASRPYCMRRRAEPEEQESADASGPVRLRCAISHTCLSALASLLAATKVPCGFSCAFELVHAL